MINNISNKGKIENEKCHQQVGFFIKVKYMLDNNKLKNLGLKYIDNSFYMLSKSRKLFKENGWYIFVEHPGNEYIIKNQTRNKKASNN